MQQQIAGKSVIVHHMTVINYVAKLTATLQDKKYQIMLVYTNLKELEGKEAVNAQVKDFNQNKI
jgi:hypothetical protein